MGNDSKGFGTVKVNTEVLQTKGEEAYAKLRAYQTALEQIQGMMSKSSGYWVGKAGDLYREVIQSQLKTAADALAVFADYPKELLEYAGVYSETISRTEAIAESLEGLDLF